MKAFIHSGIPAASIRRIVQAIGRYAPRDVKIVPSRDLADLVIHTVVGVQNFHHTSLPDLIAADRAAGRQYAIVQCCLRSTERAEPSFWLPIWRDAAVVWSYLDLLLFTGGRADFPFYHEPLGADPNVFQMPATDYPRPFTMLTSGYVAESEGVLEAADAVQRVGGKHMHLGPELVQGNHTTFLTGISDAHLAAVYARCQYVAGLRRCEGFELPAAEGLLCGARPVMFAADHYRRWFGDWARYVPEADAETVTAAIAEIIRTPQPVSEAEREAAVSMFSWERVVSGFWQRVQARATIAA